MLFKLFRHIGECCRASPCIFYPLALLLGMTASVEGVAFSSIISGGMYSCAIKSDGSVICWGFDGHGQSTPPSGTFTQVSAYSGHTCGVKNYGNVVCWGVNSENQSTPPYGSFTQVSAGSNHSCGVKTDGSVTCWGWNYHGQSTPPAGTFTQVSAGEVHSCALKTNGSLACWGSDTNGQATPPSGTFTQVSTGSNDNCAIKTDGSVVCWGRSEITPPTGTFTQVSAGNSHTCGVKTDGSIACWGNNNDYGQASPPSGIFTKVSAGFYHTCAMKKDGNAACWGNNDYGQSTLPPMVSSVSPLTATLNESTTFTVSGSNLTENTAFWIDQCEGVTQLSGGTDTQRQFQCTPSWSIGTKDAVVKDYSGGNVLLVFEVNVNQKHGLTISKTGTGQGSVTGQGINCGSDCSEQYDNNTQVALTANPNAASNFTSWSGACSGSSPSCQVTMTQTQNVTATFTLIPPKTLGVLKQGNGTVMSSPLGINCGSDCQESYNFNTSVTLSAYPATDYTFAGWNGVGCSGTGTCTITMSNDENVMATFDYDPEVYPLTVNKNGTGTGQITGQGINCGSDCIESHNAKTLVNLTATPTADSSFVGWGGACSGTGTCQVTMTVAQNVTATFKLDGPPITNQCVYKITPTNRSHCSNVETGSITVSVQSGCSWTAQSNTVWANITSGSIGEGNGSVTYLITANSTSQNRSSGTLTIAGQTFTLFQNSIECSYSITPTNHSHSANAETGSISVKVPTGCQWTAHSTVPWVNVTAGHNGQGAGIVTYSIDPNTSLQNRQGTLTIAGQTFTVNQGTPPNTPPTPVVSVTPSQGKPPLTVTADGRESYDREGIIETYGWTTSDGQTASTPKTSFTFTKEGNYDITLLVTDEGNLSDSETKTVTVSSATTYLSNLSTRARIQGGSGDIIAGFGIRGKETQRILLRGISLEHGVDPELVLQNYSTQEVLGKNNNWEQDSRHAEIPRGMRPDNENDAALLRDLPKGYYTVQLSSKGAKALGIVEVIRLSKTPPVNKLFNISTRALVQGGAYDIIAGFIIKGEGLQKVVIRGTAVDARVDPVLILQELGKTEVMAQNDNWQDSPRASEIPEHLQFGLKSTDAALLLALPEGKYTVILTSLGAKKLGLIEVVAIK